MKNKSNTKANDIQEIPENTNILDDEEGMEVFVPEQSESNNELIVVNQKIDTIIENVESTSVEKTTNEITNPPTYSLGDENTSESSNISYVYSSEEPKFHPIRNGEPLMKKRSMNGFKLSLLEFDQKENVTILDGFVLHGRNIANACFELGKPYRCVYYTGTVEDIPEFLRIKNLNRYHHTKSDLACIGAEMVDGVKLDSKEKLRKKISEIRSGKTPSLAEPVHTYKYIADLVGDIGTTSIKDYYELLKEHPDLYAKVKDHTLTFSEAKKQVLPKVSKPKITRLQVDENTYALINKLAEIEGISPSELIKKAIENYNKITMKPSKTRSKK
ncbi:MAG: CopG family transcriptional regulator [Bacteroidetes bacterium]|nr:MAG: CopG family transcriptional regulator [Bacteroidota bacterium]